LAETVHELIRLQRVDTEIAELQRHLAEIPLQRTQARESREQTRAAAEQARERLQLEQRQERRLETELNDKEALCKKLESQSYEVASNHAYKAILREIEEARRFISEHETAVLERMEAIEEAERALKESEADAEKTERQSANQDADLEARERELQQELARLQDVYRTRAALVEPDLLKRYQTIKLRRTPVIAVMGSGTSCPKCRIELPPQLALDLRNGDGMATCRSCDRILVGPHVMAAAIATES
jgi:predicted  nucleic acid-binding Zn-ribbon protein